MALLPLAVTLAMAVLQVPAAALAMAVLAMAVLGASDSCGADGVNCGGNSGDSTRPRLQRPPQKTLDS